MSDPKNRPQNMAHLVSTLLLFTMKNVHQIESKSCTYQYYFTEKVFHVNIERRPRYLTKLISRYCYVYFSNTETAWFGSSPIKSCCTILMHPNYCTYMMDRRRVREFLTGSVFDFVWWYHVRPEERLISEETSARSGTVLIRTSRRSQNMSYFKRSLYYSTRQACHRTIRG